MTNNRQTLTVEIVYYFLPRYNKEDNEFQFIDISKIRIDKKRIVAFFFFFLKEHLKRNSVYYIEPFLYKKQNSI